MFHLIARSLSPLLTLLQACLNAPEPADSNGVDAENAVESPEESHAAAPAMPQAMPQGNMQRNSVPQAPYMTADQQQALQYQAYMQQQQQGAYPMPPQQGMHQQR